MIDLIPTGTNDQVLGLRIEGSVDSADLDAVTAAFEARLARHDRLRIYAEVGELKGISAAALLEDLKLSLRHFRDVEREAIVTDAGWLASLARLGDLIPGVEVRRFSFADREEALAWINARGGQVAGANRDEGPGGNTL